jgi:single-strand DNA-binding protein
LVAIPQTKFIGKQLLLNVNRVTLLGNVIEDPTVRSTKTGTKVANFRVATSKSWKDKDGERKSSRQFHRCTVFGGPAEFVGTLVKGDAVYVEGELTYGSYEKDGQKVYTTDVNIGFDGKVIALDIADDEGDTNDDAAPF